LKECKIGKSGKINMKNSKWGKHKNCHCKGKSFVNIAHLFSNLWPVQKKIYGYGHWIASSMTQVKGFLWVKG
jgi:hypothetical protein